MPPPDMAQLAHLCVQVMKDHWETAVAPFADAVFWETGKSVFGLLRARLAGSPSSAILEDAAADPASKEKSEVLEKQLVEAMGANKDLAAAVAALLSSLPARSSLKATQIGDNNTSVQNVGSSNTISIRTV